MKIQNIDIEYFVDYLEKEIHVLECGYSYSKLANIAGPEFKKELVQSEHLLIDVLDFDWFIYCLGGLVLNVDGYNLNLVNKNKTKLHRPFLGRTERM